MCLGSLLCKFAHLKGSICDPVINIAQTALWRRVDVPGYRAIYSHKDGRHATAMEVWALGYRSWGRVMRGCWIQMGRLGNAKLSADPGTRTSERGSRQSIHANLRCEIPGRFERISQT
jgi:hypothetical protein